MTTANKIIYEIQAAYTGRGEVKQLGEDLKSLKQVESFQAMQSKFSALNEEFVAAKQRMRDLRAEMAKPGNSALAGEYENSVAAVNKLATAINKQKDLLDGQRPVLRGAGVDLTNLSGEYDRLKQSINGLSKIQAMRNLLGIRAVGEVKDQISGLTRAYREAAKAGFTSSADQQRALAALRAKTRELYATIEKPPKLQNARNLLGFSSDAEINAKIKQLQQAYVSLATSGKLSLGELSRAKAKLGQQIDELRGKTNNWRDTLSGIKGTAVEVGGALAGIVFPAREGIAFEKSMARVGKVVDAPKDKINALGNELQLMTRKIPMAAGELAEIAAAGGQLGIAVTDIKSFTDVTARMATAFDMPAQETGEAIGKLKNIFNLTIPEIEKFGDAINQLGNNSATNEKNITEVLLRVGGTAQLFGLAREKTAALAAAMLALGKPPEVAATGINALLNRMQTATEQAKPFQEALTRIGMNAEQMAQSVVKNPQKAITDLLNTLAKLDKRKQAEVMTGLFGAEYQDDLAILVNGMKTYEDALSQVADSTKFAGAMNKEFEKQCNTTGNQLILLKNAVMEIVRNIGTGLLPVIDKGAEWLTALLTPIASLTQKFPELSGAIVAFVSGAIVLNTVKRIFDVTRLAMLSFGAESITALGSAGTAAKTLEAGSVSSFGRIGGAASKLGALLKGLGGILAALAIGWEIGSWLNQFSIVQKGMTTLIHYADLLQLSARRMWRALTGGDTAEIDKNIEIAKQAYAERLKEIDEEVAEKDKPKEEIKPEQSQPKPEPQPEKKPEPDSIDGFTLRELEAMDTWDEAALTPERKAAVEKYREKKKAADAADEEKKEKEEDEKPAAEAKEAEDKEKAILELEKEEQEVIREEYSEPSLLAKERSGQLAREKEERLAREREEEAEQKGAEAERKKKREEEEKQKSFSESIVPDGNDEEWQKSLEAAKEYEKRMQEAHEAVAESGKAAAEEWADAQGEAADQAKSAFQKYFDKVKSLQDEMVGRERSLAEELDELDTTTSAESKWKRRAKEAKDYEQAAKAAMAAGNFDEALQLSDRAKEIYGSLKGGAGSITEEQARRIALRGIKSTGEMGIDLVGRQKRDAAAQALFAMPPGVNDLFGDLTGRIRGKMAGVAAGQGEGQGKDQVAKVHELKFAGGSLRGGEADVEALLDLLAQAGMSAA